MEQVTDGTFMKDAEPIAIFLAVSDLPIPMLADSDFLLRNCD